MPSIFDKKSILITGGTGTFGFNFTKYLLENHKCKRIVIFSRDEVKQLNMREEFKNNKNLRYFIGDVRDLERLNQATNSIDILIHAAAMKQVPAAEYNPTECIKTNILGAQNVITSCVQNRVKKVIALSTDKAVNPVNLYGATKLASDKLFVAANNIVGNHPTLFSVVRYGNVIGSRGSVYPYFMKVNKKKLGYFPITDIRMTRFWYKLEDAIKFVVQSLDLMRGGEIFVPKIPSIKIIDLAKSINPKFKIKIVGIRPGEKIHEIMCPKDESQKVIEFKNYFVIQPSTEFGKIKKINFLISKKKEKGKKVKQFFEYDSGSNNHFLGITELKKMNKLY